MINLTKINKIELYWSGLMLQFARGCHVVCTLDLSKVKVEEMWFGCKLHTS